MALADHAASHAHREGGLSNVVPTPDAAVHDDQAGGQGEGVNLLEGIAECLVNLAPFCQAPSFQWPAGLWSDLPALQAT
jgi:hypothetical protein